MPVAGVPGDEAALGQPGEGATHRLAAGACPPAEGDEARSPGAMELGATLTFGVADIDAARAHLEAHDVRFDGETSEVPGMVRLATFYDPDGNTFMLAQRLDGGEGRG
ncbi:MAG TPA: VOC family protein [Gaiellales bacterium]|nr:VOC family protein [Gaiellales bacterium]